MVSSSIQSLRRLISNSLTFPLRAAAALGCFSGRDPSFPHPVSQLPAPRLPGRPSPSQLGPRPALGAVLDGASSHPRSAGSARYASPRQPALCLSAITGAGVLGADSRRSSRPGWTRCHTPSPGPNLAHANLLDAAFPPPHPQQRVAMSNVCPQDRVRRKQRFRSSPSYSLLLPPTFPKMLLPVPVEFPLFFKRAQRVLVPGFCHKKCHRPGGWNG